MAIKKKRKTIKERKEILSNIKELGATGTNIFGGFITEEYNSDLQGTERRMDVYNKMRNGDGMVQALLFALELPLRSAKWFVTPPDDASAQEKQATEFIKEALFERMSISFDDFLRHALLMNTFGFIPFEKVYKFEDGKIWWKKLAPRLPKTIIRWFRDEGGGLLGIEQQVLTDDRGFLTVEIPVEKLVLFTNRQEGSNFEGVSMLRAAYKHWFMKDVLYKIAAIGAERNAIGTPVGKLPESGVVQEDKTKLEDIVKNFRINEEFGVVLPAGFDLTILDGKFNAEQIMKLVQHHDSLMAKSVLAQFLQLGQESRGGAFALSADQSDFFIMCLQAQANYIADTMNRHAIKQLVDFNFTVDRYPKLDVRLGELDKQATIESITKLVEKQVILPDDGIEEFVRKLINLPEMDKKKPIPRKPRGEIKASELLRRKKTEWERGVNFTEINDAMETGEARLMEETSEVMELQKKDLVNQVDKALTSGSSRALEEIETRFQGRYNDTINKNMKRDLERGERQVEKEHDLPKTTTPASASRWISVKSRSLSDLHAGGLKTQAQLVTLNSLVAGKTTKAILFDVKNKLDVWGATQINRTAAVTVNEALNQGRNITARKARFDFAQYSAILDDRTSELCSSLDGKVIETSNPDFERFTPPLHNNCRSVWVYIGKEARPPEVTWKGPSQSLVNRSGNLVAHE